MIKFIILSMFLSLAIGLDAQSAENIIRYQDSTRACRLAEFNQNLSDLCSTESLEKGSIVVYDVETDGSLSYINITSGDKSPLQCILEYIQAIEVNLGPLTDQFLLRETKPRKHTYSITLNSSK